MKHDPTLSPDSAYGSTRWTAQRLGLSQNNFTRKRAMLEAEGLPKPDPLLGRYIKADVDAWIEKRRRVADPVGPDVDAKGIDLGAV